MSTLIFTLTLDRFYARTESVIILIFILYNAIFYLLFGPVSFVKLHPKISDSIFFFTNNTLKYTVLNGEVTE